MEFMDIGIYLHVLFYSLCAVETDIWHENVFARVYELKVK